jgi:hypothetical protein
MTEIITMIANIALALSFIVGLIFGIAQVKTAARDRRERLTIQTVHDFQTREFVDLMQFILTAEMLGSFVTTSWEKYKTLFTNIREVTPDPFLGEYFQWLAERIDERMKNNPRQPYHLTGRY